MKYLGYVNTKMGSNFTYEFSRGGTLPIAARPFGVCHFFPETRDGLRPFHPDDVRVKGIRLTHQFSPWLEDYNTFTLGAYVKEATGVYEKPMVSSYNRRSACLMPSRIALRLNLYDTDMSLVPTRYGGVFSLSFGDLVKGEGVLTLSVPKGNVEAVLLEDRQSVALKVRNGMKKISDKFWMYCIFKTDKPCEKMIVNSDNGCVELIFPECERNITARFACSMISHEQAEFLLESETDGKDSGELLRICEDEWEKYLSLIAIDADTEMMRAFYSCLYRCFLFPRPMHEPCPDGKTRYRYPEDGAVYEGILYNDMALWDGYRTVFPLWSLILPERYAEICEGLMSYYRHSGFLPRTMSCVPINCMPGTAVDNIFADAAVKEIITDRERLYEMLEALCKHARIPSDRSAYGRDGIEEFNSCGYVTTERGESVSKTLDYSYGNFCISKLAQCLSEHHIAEQMRESAKSWRRLFDPETGYLRGRDRDGNMRKDFTKYDWGGEYTEAGPIQTSLGACFDILGYAELLGGQERLHARLMELFAEKPLYRVLGYKKEIHEMTEMAEFPQFGQCALSNQPSFHIPYLFSAIGDRNSASFWTRKATRELFSADGGFPGDEDTGSMSAWYVFSVLGFYPLCQGTGEYVLSSPAVRSAEIRMPKGVFRISAENNAPDRIYCQTTLLNGRPYNKLTLTHSALTSGGTLTLKMSNIPPSQSYTALPYTL